MCGDSPFECQNANAIQITMVVLLQRYVWLPVPCNQLRAAKIQKILPICCEYTHLPVWVSLLLRGLNSYASLTQKHTTSPILILFVFHVCCLMMKYLSSTSNSQEKNLFMLPGLKGFKHGLTLLASCTCCLKVNVS